MSESAIFASQKLKSLWVRLVSTDMLRSVGLLTGGTVLAQGITLLTTPLLTRLFTPQDFGVLAVYASLLGLFAVTATLRYEFAIPLTQDDGESCSLTVLCVLLSVSVAVITSVLFWIWGQQVLGQFKSTVPILPYIWLLPVGLGLNGMYQTLSYVANRSKRFEAISKTKVSQSIGMSVIQMVSGLGGLGPGGLVTGHVVGQCLGIGTLYRQTRPFSVKHRLSLSSVLNSALRHWRFPVFSSTAAIIAGLGIQAMPLFFASFFGVAISGAFALTTRVLNLPAALIGTAVSQVLYPEMVERADDPPALLSLLRNAATALFLAGTPVFALIFLWGQEIFAVCFGKQWFEAGNYAQLLAPWLLINFVSSPISSLTQVRGKQRNAFLMTVYESALRISAIVVGSNLGSAQVAVGLYSCAGAIICAVYIAWIFRLAGGTATAWLVSLMPYTLTAALLTVILLGLKPILPPVAGFSLSLATMGLLLAVSMYKYNHVVFATMPVKRQPSPSQ